MKLDEIYQSLINKVGTENIDISFFIHGEKNEKEAKEIASYIAETTGQELTGPINEENTYWFAVGRFDNVNFSILFKPENGSL